MCESCLADAETLGEIIPGWSALRSRKITEHMRVGDIALTSGNGPSVVFPSVPTPDPMGGWTDEEVEACSPAEWLAFMEWENVATCMTAAFRSDLVDARLTWQMVEAARKVGYRPDEDESFELWVIDRVGRLVAGQPLKPTSKATATHNAVR